MKGNVIRIIGACLVVCLWFALAAMAWVGPRMEYSDSERRALKQFPQITWDRIMDMKFMGDFNTFSMDQFPLREQFRQLKAVFHFYGLQQSDKDELYVEDGYLAKMDGTVNEVAVNRAGELFTSVYENVLKGKTDNLYFSVVPDKNYYFGPESGHKAMDVTQVESILQEHMAWASYIDIKHTLSKDSYYHTDTHWRQESILPVAQQLCSAMGTKVPSAGQVTVRTLDRPFYGVYYGQVAVPVKPDPLNIVESETILGCKVTSLSSGNPKQISMYNTEGLDEMKDPYNVFLYGFDETCVIIENPNAATDRELILFRDSYGCSMAPLLVEDYARVTVIDLRSFNYRTALPNLERMGMMNLENADVLFLYSTLVLNNPQSFRVQ